MRATLTITALNKIDVLRQYEIYCYQICHYLLTCESHASLAAEAALLHIAEDTCFFTDSDEVRKEKIRQTSIRVSLSKYREFVTI